MNEQNFGKNDTYAKADDVALAPEVADEIKYSTCYMCACRCGIRVYLKDGQVKYIDGNPDHPVNRGVLCAKGSAGIMQHLSPARLQKPLKRVGERGRGEFEEIEWDEALELATKWLGDVRENDPRKLAFFTGRDQSQSLTGWWATQFGTPNFAAHGGFCSVNMAAAGLYTIGGAFWEFGEPDWDHTKYFMMFGIAEDHDSNPIKIGLGELKKRGDAKIVSVNPVRTGYSAVADEWIGLKPGTDGLFIGAIIHCLMKAEKIDWDFVSRYTNGGQLVFQSPGDADHGLIARDEEDDFPLAWDLESGSLKDASNSDIRPALVGDYDLPDGRRAVPAFQLFASHYMDDAFAPETVADRCAIAAEDIRRIAAEMAEVAFEQEITIEQEWTDWAGRKHDKFIGRPVSFHAMRGISAHSNGFHTCRMLHHLQIMLGAVDSPGSFRYKAPFPKPLPPGPRPHGHVTAPDAPLAGPPIGNPLDTSDLLVDDAGNPLRIDKAFSWENPLSIHGLMHMVLKNAWAQDPYPIDTLFMYMANMAWNSSMNTKEVTKYLTDKDADGNYRIKNFIYSDAYWSETVAYADLILPDTTYLERWDAISLLDRPISSAHGPGDAIRQPVVEPDRDVRGFQSVLLDLGARLGLPGMTNTDGSPKYPGGYSDYIVNHQRGPGMGPLAGWRGENGESEGRGGVNPDQLDRYIENGGFWQHHLPDHSLYMKHGNRDYLDYAHHMGWIPDTRQITLSLYDETLQKFRLAAEGHGDRQPPDNLRERVKTYMSPLPIWYEPFESTMLAERDKYPLSAITQRPAHMYHSWGSQNAWLRQITARNVLFVHPETAQEAGIEDEAWAWIEGYKGRVKAQVKHMWGTNRGTVWTWNAIGKRKGAWGLDKDAPETTKAFLLNHLISETLPDSGLSNSDPVTGQAAWFDLNVRIYPCEPHEAGETEPMFEPQAEAPGKRVNEGRYGERLKGERTDNVAGDTLAYGTTASAGENK